MHLFFLLIYLIFKTESEKFTEHRLITKRFSHWCNNVFIALTSPKVFKTLEKEYPKQLLRFIFPRLVNFCFSISTCMFLFFVLAEFDFGMVAGIIIAIGFLINTYHLTPRINKMQELMIIGHSG